MDNGINIAIKLSYEGRCSSVGTFVNPLKKKTVQELNFHTKSKIKFDVKRGPWDTKQCFLSR